MQPSDALGDVVAVAYLVAAGFFLVWAIYREPPWTRSPWALPAVVGTGTLVGALLIQTISSLPNGAVMFAFPAFVPGLFLRWLRDEDRRRARDAETPSVESGQRAN